MKILNYKIALNFILYFSQFLITSTSNFLQQECGSGLLGSLPKAHRERLTKELQEIVRCIKEHNEADGSKEGIGNKSASMIELKTPEKR